MAIKVGVSGVTAKTIAVAGSTTQVKKIVVGTPVKRVSGSLVSIDSLIGVDTSGKVNGSLLIYNSTVSLWTASKDLENQNINGGSY